MQIVLRDAKPDDAPQMGKVYVDAWRDTYAGMLPASRLVAMSYDQWAARWLNAINQRSPRSAILVAEAQDPEAQERTVVGLGSCGPNRDASLAYDGEVYTLYIWPYVQGAGLGRDMLAAMFEAMSETGYASVVIWALAANPARFFYESMGGQLVAEKMTRHWGQPVREVAFGWSDPQKAARRMSRDQAH